MRTPVYLFLEDDEYHMNVNVPKEFIEEFKRLKRRKKRKFVKEVFERIANEIIEEGYTGEPKNEYVNIIVKKSTAKKIEQYAKTKGIKRSVIYREAIERLVMDYGML